MATDPSVAGPDAPRKPPTEVPFTKTNDPPLEAILARLKNVTSTSPDQWTALCPAHDDHDPSLSIRRTTDGRMLLHCFAGCNVNSILAAVGMSLAAISGGGELDAVVAAHAARLGGAVADVWRYSDADGEPVMAVARFETSSGKSYRPFRREHDGWVLGDPPPPLPLYRLPDLQGHARIYVVEGEKCADAAAALGLAATTSAHGARGVRKTDWSPLAGREIVILPDSDAAGHKYAETVTRVLSAFNDTTT